MLHPLFIYEPSRFEEQGKEVALNSIPGVSGLLLAGGRSTRMGRDKRFLDVGGQPLIFRALSVLEQIFEEVLISVAEPVEELKETAHRIIPDRIPGCATLGGLLSGLEASHQSCVFAVACDMPFLNEALVRRMAEEAENADVVMAKLSSGVQPMHALYSKACVPYLEQMIARHCLKLQALLDLPGLTIRVLEEESVRKVDPQLLSFMNVNTPADLEFARKTLAGHARQP